MTDTYRRPEEIEREIEATRADLDETVSALEAKLSPGQIVDEVWSRVRGGGSGSGIDFGETLREHPVPLALMGLGLGWLAIESATGSRGSDLKHRHGSVGPGTYGRAEGRVGPYGPDAIAGEPGAIDRAKEKAAGAAGAVAGKASDIADSVSGAASKLGEQGEGLRHSADSGVDDLQERARVAGEEAREELRYRKAQVKQGFWEAMDEHPVVLGVLAFGAGLLGGSSVPTTRGEDELFGRTAQTLRDETRSMAKEVGASAKEVAKEGARAAKEHADREDLAGSLEETVKGIATSARDAAQSRARQEGLTAEGMKDRAESVGDRTKAEAKRETDRMSPG